MEAMTWIPVENSQALEAVCYDAASYTLGVMTKATPTKAGTPYFYIDVPPEVHQQMMRAESKGKFWLQVIKPKYQCRKGDNTLARHNQAQQSLTADPLHPKVERIISETAASAPAPAKEEATEILALTIATAPGGIRSLLELGDSLRYQLNRHCVDIEVDIDDLAKRAVGTVVIDEASYTSAAELGKSLAAKRKAITAMMKPTKKAIDSVKDVILEKEKELLTQVAAGEDHLDRICTDYRVAEKKRVREAEHAEGQRLLKEAEDKRIAEAEKAHEAGRTVLADKLLSTPVTAPKVQVEAAVPKVSGVKGRVTYKFRVKDVAAIPRDWMVPDEAALSAYARKEKLPDGTLLHGVEFYQEESTDF